MGKQAALKRLLAVVGNVWDDRALAGTSAADIATIGAMRRIRWAIYREQQGALRRILRRRPGWSGNITDEPGRTAEVPDGDWPTRTRACIREGCGPVITLTVRTWWAPWRTRRVDACWVCRTELTPAEAATAARTWWDARKATK